MTSFDSILVESVITSERYPFLYQLREIFQKITKYEELSNTELDLIQDFTINKLKGYSKKREATIRDEYYCSEVSLMKVLGKLTEIDKRENEDAQTKSSYRKEWVNWIFANLFNGIDFQFNNSTIYKIIQKDVQNFTYAKLNKKMSDDSQEIVKQTKRKAKATRIVEASTSSFPTFATYAANRREESKYVGMFVGISHAEQSAIFFDEWTNMKQEEGIENE